LIRADGMPYCAVPGGDDRVKNQLVLTEKIAGI